MGVEGGARVFRRGGARWLILFTVWWLVVLTTLGGTHVGMPAGVLATLGAAEAVIFLLAVLAHRTAVVVDAGGLTVRDMFRTQRFPWSAVSRIEVGSQGLIPGPIASVRLRDGRSIPTPLWAGGLGAGNRSMDRAVRALAEEVAARTGMLGR